MGYSDIGCYGGEIPTPNIDSLAAGGVRFTQFYNTARCSTTRASLLTGLYPHQAGMGYLDGLRKPESKGTHARLHDRCVTLAEVLGAAGYHTSIIGKWHLGQQNGTPPWERGFQRTATTQFGELYFPKERSREACKYVYLDSRKVPADSPEVGRGEWYSTLMFTDWALKFVDDAKAQAKPFFLFFAHGAPHFPLKAPQEVIAKYRGKYKMGWDVLREVRHRRQIDMGLVNPAWPLAPRPADVPAWDSLSAADQDRYDHIMAVYAAMIDCVDQSVGRMVSGLRERGLLDNTLILFLSDNGGNAEAGPRGITEGAPLGGPESRVFLGMCWATLGNTPFRRYKHFTHEGGISTPLIAYWPARIPAARSGRLERQPGHLIDLMATACDVGNADYPAEFKGHPILPLEGVSLMPAFLGQPLRRAKPIFWEHEGNRAVREGPWKAVLKFKGAWELYNIEQDRTEQRDLAAEYPDKLRALADTWEAWAAASFVDPWEGNVRNDWGEELRSDPDAPQLEGKPFTVSATVQSPRPNGVVLAQGGKAFGYALYFVDGRPAVAYRNNGALTVLVAKEAVSGRVALAASVDANALTLTVNGATAAEAKSPGLFAQQPAIGLSVGFDSIHPVGDYEIPNRFNGRVLEHKVSR
jgi:arylsulfatase